MNIRDSKAFIDRFVRVAKFAAELQRQLTVLPGVEADTRGIDPDAFFFATNARKQLSRRLRETRCWLDESGLPYSIRVAKDQVEITVGRGL